MDMDKAFYMKDLLYFTLLLMALKMSLCMTHYVLLELTLLVESPQRCYLRFCLSAFIDADVILLRCANSDVLLVMEH